jgi:16S rRNA (adenine1518-N6/adenine1519-N6)-dimethyltransferase
MIFMLQKEVVERICAAPGTKDYGKLTVMLQYRYKCRQLLQVPPQAFYPAPKVDSAIISLKPRIDYNWQTVDVLKLTTLVSHAFNQRRKTISNSLKGLIKPEHLSALKIEPSSRAENLTIDNYIALTKFI